MNATPSSSITAIERQLLDEFLGMAPRTTTMHASQAAHHSTPPTVYKESHHDDSEIIKDLNRIHTTLQRWHAGRMSEAM
jgi:hypothetical protein